MSDLSTQLREYLDATAPPVDPEEVITDEIWVPTKRQARRTRWTVPGWAYGLAAMVVVLALTLGVALLLTGADEDEVVDEPTPTTINAQPPTTKQSQPSPDLTGDSGTLDTALGPIPWIHAVEIDLVPNRGVIQTPTGFAGVINMEVADGRYVSMWVTSFDGATWMEDPPPVPLDPEADVLLGEAHGRSWLTDGTRLWLSEDTEVWTEIDGFEVTRPPSDGVMWIPRLESPAVGEDMIVFPLQLHPELPLQEIFDPGSQFTGGVRRTNCGWDWELDACQDVGDDVDVAFGIDGNTGGETLLARFRVEAEGETAYVVDFDTGSRVHEYSIAGSVGKQLVGLPSWDAILRVDPELTASVIEPPWSSFGLRHFFLAAVEGRFLAYVDRDPRPQAITLEEIEVWESGDGLTWTNLGAVDFGIEAPGEALVTMEQDDSHLRALINFDEADLISTDGLNWEPYAPDADAQNSRLEEIGGGLASFDDEGVSVSADGNQWEELISWSPRRGNIVFTAGDTLIVALDSDGGFEVWAFDFVP